MLKANNLTCICDERALFSELCFTVSPGEIVQIAGANGAGKTSLLRILVGLSRAEQGEVFWKQRPICQQREKYHARLLYLGHQPGVKTVLTASENLLFYHPQCSENAIWQALEEVGLTGFEDVAIALLSAGQQRRVALARLWLSSSTLWILDEPFTAIDTSGVATLMARFARHADNGGSVIFTAHQALPASHRTVRQLCLTASEMK